jgi:hypothetical protein
MLQKGGVHEAKSESVAEPRRALLVAVLYPLCVKGSADEHMWPTSCQEKDETSHKIENTKRTSPIVSQKLAMEVDSEMGETLASSCDRYAELRRAIEPIP